jgi:dimethylamine monooxygenase subunit A
MSVLIKPAETFRGDFSYRNSPKAVARFPFPFAEDRYQYSVNIEPAVSRDPGSVFEHAFDIDEHYRSEAAERARVLEADPRRCIVMPHMELASWDALEMIMQNLAADYPEWFSLERDGDQWHWTNRALSIDQHFTFGDAATLPYGPLEYVMRQAQGDMALLEQRDGDLFMDAGVVTGPADWSLAFDAGMSFKQWHSPVPLAHEMGVFDRALKYLLAIRAGHPVRRLNWTLTIHPRLDTSPETSHLWASDRGRVTPDNVGQAVHLRVELQYMARLPRSNGLMFAIRTYLCSLDDVTRNPVWAQRLHRVLRDLPEAVAEYKGMTRYRATLVAWLSQFDR